jgi:hypothetical protein
MSLALANALSEERGGVLNLDKIVAAYVDWNESCPDYVQQNTSIDKLKKQLGDEDIVTNAYSFTKREFTGVESNACLMRLVPLAVWGQHLDRD